MTQFFYGFRRHGRHVRQFLGYILSPFRPSLPLRFPVRERAAFAALAALGSSINSSQAPVYTPAASAQHSSRKAMFDTVFLRF